MRLKLGIVCNFGAFSCSRLLVGCCSSSDVRVWLSWGKKGLRECAEKEDVSEYGCGTEVEVVWKGMGDKWVVWVGGGVLDMSLICPLLIWLVAFLLAHVSTPGLCLLPPPFPLFPFPPLQCRL